eukprot:3721909-Alexandrium_andersonii.AAC.1
MLPLSQGPPAHQRMARRGRRNDLRRLVFDDRNGFGMAGRIQCPLPDVVPDDAVRSAAPDRARM